jgi:hypothetical protein
MVTRLRTALWYVLGGGAAALAVTMVALVVSIPPARPLPAQARVAPARAGLGRAPRALGHVTALQLPLSQILYGLVAAVLVAAIVAVTVRLLRANRRQLLVEPAPPAEDVGAALQEAIMWGQRAFLGLDDARSAIIACYSAMEQSLARAGTARSPAETPDELLGRAAGTLPVSSNAARRLTSLFYEARFSSHPLSNVQRAVAESALAELASELEVVPPAHVGAGQ